jgi:hypothetical protein
VKPSEEAAAVMALYNKISGSGGDINLSASANEWLSNAANDLLANKESHWLFADRMIQMFN